MCGGHQTRSSFSNFSGGVKQQFNKLKQRAMGGVKKGKKAVGTRMIKLGKNMGGTGGTLHRPRYAFGGSLNDTDDSRPPRTGRTGKGGGRRTSKYILFFLHYIKMFNYFLLSVITHKINKICHHNIIVISTKFSRLIKQTVFIYRDEL